MNKLSLSSDASGLAGRRRVVYKSNDPSGLCNHCKKKRACRPRGLCWTCYIHPEIRCLYSMNHIQCESKAFGEAGGGVYSEIKDYNGPSKLPDEPTQAVPGSPEKFAVLEARALRGEALFHPLDRPQDPEIDRRRRA